MIKSCRLWLGATIMDDIAIEEPHSVREYYCDGFGTFRKINGVLRCTGYVIETAPHGSIRIATVKLIISLAGANQAQMEARRVLDETPTKGIHIWQGDKVSH